MLQDKYSLSSILASWEEYLPQATEYEITRFLTTIVDAINQVTVPMFQPYNYLTDINCSGRWLFTSNFIETLSALYNTNLRYLQDYKIKKSVTLCKIFLLCHPHICSNSIKPPHNRGDYHPDIPITIHSITFDDFVRPVISRVDMDLKANNRLRAIQRLTGFLAYMSEDSSVRLLLAKLYYDDGNYLKAGQYFYFKEAWTFEEKRCVDIFIKRYRSPVIRARKLVISNNFSLARAGSVTQERLWNLIVSIKETHTQLPKFLKNADEYLSRNLKKEKSVRLRLFSKGILEDSHLLQQ